MIKIETDSSILRSNDITAFMHCGQCIAEWKAGGPEVIDKSPKEYSDVGVGYTSVGMQVWCNRHECNIAYITISEGKLDD